MKLLFKIVAWIAGIAIVGFIGLYLAGVNMAHKSEDFLKENGFTEVSFIQSTDKVICHGPDVGVVVAGKANSNDKLKIYPVCTPLFGESSLGEWRGK